MTFELEPIKRMSRDIANAAKLISDDEARFLVDAYYTAQDNRIRSNNQVRALDKTQEPNEVLQWLTEQEGTMEKQIARALDKYTQEHPMGEWMRGIHGIGPVLAAGLLAHIDIKKAVTAGHIWRFAGLDPTVKWEKGKKRPFNATLKTLCWKIGQSFMKFSGDEKCFYGKIYLERKQFEMDRNAAGGNKEAAAKMLTEKKYDKTTEAYKHLSEGRLPPGQIDARARRYAVKIFLSHLQQVWYKQHHGVDAPKPFAIAILGHAHMIDPPVFSHSTKKMIPPEPSFLDRLREAWKVLSKKQS